MSNRKSFATNTPNPPKTKALSVAATPKTKKPTTPKKRPAAAKARTTAAKKPAASSPTAAPTFDELREMASQLILPTDGQRAFAVDYCQPAMKDAWVHDHEILHEWDKFKWAVWMTAQSVDELRVLCNQFFDLCDDAVSI